MRLGWVGVACLAAGCATFHAASGGKAAPPDSTAADALLARGCLSCLEQASAAYEAMATGAWRLAFAPRQFEAGLLVALRQKELAIDPAATIGALRRIAVDLPAGSDPERYLRLLAAIPPDARGTPRADQFRFRLAQSDIVRRLPDDLAWLETAPLRPIVNQYLAWSLRCTFASRAPGVIEEPPSEVDAGAPPLLRYRQATCGRIDGPALERVRSDVPDFVETDYFLGTIAMADLLHSGTVARRAIEEVSERLPQSASISQLTATFYGAIGDQPDALRWCDHTIALQPLHEDALLGRVSALTLLNRTAEAIAAATQIVNQELDNVGDALYWRAFNQRAAHDLDAARRDIDAARRSVTSGAVLTLAGMIEFDRGELPDAGRDLRRALTMPGADRNCPAEWYLGAVQSGEKAFGPAADTFERAAACYGRDAAEAADTAASIAARNDLDPEYRRYRLETLRRQVADSQTQRHAAALNVADFSIMAGNIDRARQFVAIAAEDQALAEGVAAVRDYLNRHAGS